MKRQSGVSINFVRFGDPRIDAALDKGRGSADPAERARAYAEVQRAFADQVPYIWLTHVQRIVATLPRVRAAHNVTLPNGAPALPFDAGVHRLTETWVQRPEAA